MGFTPALSIQLADPNAEAVRRNEDQRIGELQRLLMAGARLIQNVRIPGTTISDAVTVSHGLGRAPSVVFVSAPRVDLQSIGSLTAGLVVDSGQRTFSGGPLDRTRVIQLGAFGFGVTVTVDVVVM